MIENKKITDRNSLKQWLNEWPVENGLDDTAARAIAVSIAHRAAMRVLPAWWEWTLGKTARKLDLTALPVLRCNLISGVTGYASSPEIKAAAADAADVVATAAITDAVATAAIVAAAVTAAIPAVTTAVTAATTAVDATVLWAEIRTDCAALSEGQQIVSAPLWSDRENQFEAMWHAIKPKVSGSEWDFWIKWYDDALAGGAPDWDMLEQIALIDSPVWEEGPKAVNARIALIVEQHELAADVRAARANFGEVRKNMAALAQRSHNNPPEMVDADTFLVGKVENIWTALAEAEEELEHQNPSLLVLKRVGLVLLNACKSIAAYCANLGDIALKKAAEAFGSAGGKLVAGGIIAYVATQIPGVQSLGSRLLELAEKWPL